MKFIADAMLGRLAKWLRLLGFDVLYYPVIDDRQVVRIAMEQERTILTRDTRLLKRKGLKDPVFIGSDDISDQLREIKGMLNFSDADPLGRCIQCNGQLVIVSGKNEIRDLVPDFIYHSFNDFIKCEACAKVYWNGTHYEKIRERIREVLSATADHHAGR